MCFMAAATAANRVRSCRRSGSTGAASPATSSETTLSRQLRLTLQIAAPPPHFRNENHILDGNNIHIGSGEERRFHQINHYNGVYPFIGDVTVKWQGAEKKRRCALEVNPQRRTPHSNNAQRLITGHQFFVLLYQSRIIIVKCI